MKSQKSEAFCKILVFFSMLMMNGKESTFPSVEGDIDGNPSTDDDTHSQKRKGSLKAHVESISSDSLIEDVESIDEDLPDEKEIYLLKEDMSSKDCFEGIV